MKAKITLIAPLLLMAGMILAISYEPKVSEYVPIVSERTNLSTSNEAFDKMMNVLTHERCMNGHPNDNIPKQGEDSHPHYFGMARGENNMGFQAA